MSIVRPVLMVLLLVLLAACESTPSASPPSSTTTTTTTTRPEPTNPVKDLDPLHTRMATVRSWFASCAPGLPRPPGCDWRRAHAHISIVTSGIENAVADSAHPQSYISRHLVVANGEVSDALFTFSISCAHWLRSGNAGVVTNLGCPDDWDSLLAAWTELEAAVTSS